MPQWGDCHLTRRWVSDNGDGPFSAASPVHRPTLDLKDQPLGSDPGARPWPDLSDTASGSSSWGGSRHLKLWSRHPSFEAAAMKRFNPREQNRGVFLSPSVLA